MKESLSLSPVLYKKSSPVSDTKNTKKETCASFLSLGIAFFAGGMSTSCWPSDPNHHRGTACGWKGQSPASEENFWLPAAPVAGQNSTPFHPVVQVEPFTLQNSNFSGVLARPFDTWSFNTLPCFEPEEDWYEMTRQNEPSNKGFLFVKPYKTASSTTSGVNLRIARNVARREQTKYKVCRARFDHGPDYYPGYTLYKNRDPNRSFLWTVIRDPTERATSQFFHFKVSREKIEPSDENFQSFLLKRQVMQDYYYRALHTKGKFNRSVDDPVVAANAILEDYNFIGVTERLDESFVVLMMQMNLRMADILYLSAKERGGYDDGEDGPDGCAYIWPSFLSVGMQDFFANNSAWKDTVTNDNVLYKAVNRSLDLTIDRLGRDNVAAQLARFRRVRETVLARCSQTAVFPCDSSGRYHKKTDCLWKDSSCGTSCLDEIATELDLW
jgi:hypothetical protein